MNSLFIRSPRLAQQTLCVKQQRGFTLIELLLALGIMAIFALLAYRGLDSVLRLHQYAYERQQYTQSIDRALIQLEIDLRQANDVTLIAIKNIKPKASIALRIVRRVNHQTVTIQWFVENRQLVRMLNFPSTKGLLSATQTANMLSGVDKIDWVTLQDSLNSTDASAMAREWQPLLSELVDAQPSGLLEQLYQSVGIRLNLSGKVLDKYFLIGR